MKKIFCLLAVIFPIVTGFSLASANLWWQETKNLALLLKPASIMTNNKWGLNSLRGYDDGLMPSIRSNVMIGLQNNLGTAVVKNLNVEIYYGHVDDNNFYNAKAIDFNDFTNTNYIFWFTVGIFATEKSAFTGHKFLEFDYRPTWDFADSKFVKFDNSSGTIDSVAKLVTNWNKLLNNKIVLDNFNYQFQKMDLDITAGMELQPGQMVLNQDVSFFMNLSDAFAPEQNDLLTITPALFKYIPERLLTSLFKISNQPFTMQTAPVIKIKSKDFKDHNFDYAILNNDVTLEIKLNSLYVDMKQFVVNAMQDIYNYAFSIDAFELQFRKNGYSDPILLDGDTNLGDLYTFTTPDGGKKHWVWLELINAKDTSLDLSALPGVHLGFKV
ncbi:hypothetical protein [Spiroplasma sp. SV19]|uniref:hypothetical protein n=1 Tax=Spiroplasma sp. SV19 TaxID=2570468 RepID=UPI0024B70916|nr:hypothetical protein [Spiroplasma sp. SV19]WHQ37211.1 hypothetical protein E7Y35_04900 [Spiroplasma sp. SV19]